MDLAHAKGGDRGALGRIVADHMWLVRHFAQHFGRYQVERDDLISQGTIGLIDAVHHHDPSRGTAFNTTASYWVRLRMFEFIRSERTHGMSSPGMLAGRIFTSVARMWADSSRDEDPIGSFVDRVHEKTGNRPSREHAADIVATFAPKVRLNHVPIDLPAPDNPERAFAKLESDRIVRASLDVLEPDELDIVERTIMGDEPLANGRDRESHRVRAKRGRLRNRAIGKLRDALHG